jgi:hypothetical protein
VGQIPLAVTASVVAAGIAVTCSAGLLGAQAAAHPPETRPAATAAAPATATPAAIPTTESAHPELSTWVAGAQHARLKTRFGTKHNRALYLVGIQWRRPLRTFGPLHVAYRVNVLPVIVATKMPTYDTIPYHPCPSCQAAGLMTVQNFSTVYGAGIEPVGLDAAIGGPRHLQLRVGASGGMVYFEDPIPDPAECKLNFIANVVTRVSVPLWQGHRIEAGYRYNHISNGGRGPVNPGMDSNMFELGVSWALSRR